MTTTKVEDFTAVINKLAGTSNLGRDLAANVWAGLTTIGTSAANAQMLSLVGALNVKAGNGTNPSKWRGLRAVCNQLAGTTELEPLQALQQLAGLT